ncbi:hypothetical protein K491DRAFT_122536 [Lophiostoma macrostomum CBS 122681]|uniref:Uncharacterized protein n=1 Tax=Lophiostoma macrostomum CBS 122681 TaxID=1314788 RepID=A0A6A6TLX9_9PLEO|nr:hypothetical protein K491DRAFT_122536 [Lophiostoma macrostomum CBS 122681]
MGWPTATTVYLHHLPLFPAPLQVKKKPRRSAFRRLSTRRPPLAQAGHAGDGPLDDIIHLIVGDISHSPLDETRDELLSECSTTSGQPFAWNVTPLPVSRTPSDQPLRIPKTRNSRSSGSGSTFSDILSASQSSSKCEYFDYRVDTSQHCTSCTCFFGVRPLHIVKSSLPLQASSDQLSTINETITSPTMSTESQSLRKRLTSLTAGVGRIHFGTSSKGKARSVSLFPKHTSSTSSGNETLAGINNQERAQGATSNIEMMEIVTEEPYNADETANNREGPMNTTSSEGNRSPTLAVAVKVLPEVQLLGEDDAQSFWVTIEVEGVLHQQHMVGKPPMDFIVLIDLTFYATDGCLYHAERLILDMLSHLGPADRIGLYTTHCTHDTVTGTSPEMLCPLEPVTQHSRDTLRNQLAALLARGSQHKNPPRPNPAMSEVIRAVTQPVKLQGPASGRAHLFLLSSSAQELHEVSSFEPELYIDHINPAIIPFAIPEKSNHQETQSTLVATTVQNGTTDSTPDSILDTIRNLETKICHKECCHKVTVHNLAQYESLSDGGRRLVQYARYKASAGLVHNVFVDLKQENGCEIIQYEGSQRIPVLRLGQTHYFSIEIKVDRSIQKPLSIDSLNPIRLTALDMNKLRAKLHYAATQGAELVHPLSAQAFYQYALEKTASWACTEAPMTAFKGFGEMERPRDRAMEVYKRRLHQPMAAADPEAPLLVAARLLVGVKPPARPEAKKLLALMARERKSQKASLDFASATAGSLRFLGRTGMTPAHEWED